MSDRAPSVTISTSAPSSIRADKSMRRIGIDVGGTNTDAVLLEDGRVAHAVKTPTTSDVTTGIVTALAELTRRSEEASLLYDRMIALARATIAGFVSAVSGVAAPLYLTQNDGTMMQAEMAAALPVMSFSSGATNSMRGAAFLSGLTDAMVIDVGGTTTDIGQLRRGFPRAANSVVEVGGGRTCSRMHDLLVNGECRAALVSADC